MGVEKSLNGLKSDGQAQGHSVTHAKKEHAEPRRATAFEPYDFNLDTSRWGSKKHWLASSVMERQRDAQLTYA